MKKSIKRIISLAIALIMTASAFATLTFTTSALTTADLTNGLTKLLSMDDITGKNIWKNTIKDVTYTLSSYAQGVEWEHTTAEDSGEIISSTVVATATGWHGYCGNTNLPLNANSKYTIQYTAAANSGASHFGFFFSHENKTLNGIDGSSTYNNNNNMQGVYIDDDNVVYGARGMLWSGSAELGKYTVGNLTITNQNVYTLAIDGYVVAVYINGNPVGAFDFADDKAFGGYSSNVLSLGSRARESSKAVMMPSNVAVYEGVVDINRTVTFTDSTGATLKTDRYKVGDVIETFPTLSGVTDDSVVMWVNEATGMPVEAPYTVVDDATICGYVYDEGDVMLKLSSLNTDAKVEGATALSEHYQGPQNAKAGEAADGIYAATDTSGASWELYGVQTDLPLNENSKYTIEYKVKENDSGNVNTGMCYSVGAWNNAQGVYIYDGSMTSIHGYSSQSYNLVGGGVTHSFKNNMTTYADKDGYTTFTVEINGHIATLYLGGEKVDAVNFADPVSDVKSGYTSSNLALMFRSRTGQAISAGTLIANVKDITVYSGNIMSGRLISFEDEDGTALKEFRKDSGVEITAEDFPEVTPSAADKQIVWRVKGTNVIALAPYTVVGDVTFTACEVSKTAVECIGSQMSVDSKTHTSGATVKDIRFVGGIYDLDGSAVGFEISSGDKKWDRSNTVVYKSIIENVNGEENTIKAEDKGVFYLFALKLENIPVQSETITFTVKPYIVVNGARIYGSSYTVSVTDGDIDG